MPPSFAIILFCANPAIPSQFCSPLFHFHNNGPNTTLQTSHSLQLPACAAQLLESHSFPDLLHSHNISPNSVLQLHYSGQLEQLSYAIQIFRHTCVVNETTIHIYPTVDRIWHSLRISFTSKSGLRPIFVRACIYTPERT